MSQATKQQVLDAAAEALKVCNDRIERLRLKIRDAEQDMDRIEEITEDDMHEEGADIKDLLDEVQHIRDSECPEDDQ